MKLGYLQCFSISLRPIFVEILSPRALISVLQEVDSVGVLVDDHGHGLKGVQGSEKMTCARKSYQTGPQTTTAVSYSGRLAPSMIHSNTRPGTRIPREQRYLGPTESPWVPLRSFKLCNIRDVEKKRAKLGISGAARQQWAKKKP
ncbi:uncharacterized protein L3040_005233 [Drepanopeziza brunnea f. sp. 'multigermtubi']|uniref:uncharacterized protein n=1 Tax=Drepanopeziza brunnea f. sp. 'multigermtubi' TaxID=698441 RepID=UPI00238B37FC|nr:hypothetical protein L3040_005233 [Drepanopeziza brunnea f. sp. 'multigermtubi']